MGEYIFLGLFLLIVYLMIRVDVKSANEVAAWYDYEETHRHCCERPYKISRRNL